MKKFKNLARLVVLGGFALATLATPQKSNAANIDTNLNGFGQIITEEINCTQYKLLTKRDAWQKAIEFERRRNC